MFSIPSGQTTVRLVKHPVRCIIAGGSGTGKTVLLCNLLINSHRLISSETTTTPKEDGFDLVILVYKTNQPAYDILRNFYQSNIITFQTSLVGVDDDDDGQDDAKQSEIVLKRILDERKPQRPVIVFDDGIGGENFPFLVNIYTRLSHHLNLSSFLLTQTLFDQTNCKRSGYLRILNRNATLLLLTKNPRDVNSLRILVHQFHPNLTSARQLISEILSALTEPYSYIALNFSQETPDLLRVVGNLLHDKKPYLPFVICSPQAAQKYKNPSFDT